MATSGKISARNPLAQLDSSVWFAIITQRPEGNGDWKVNLEQLTEYMAATAKSPYDVWLEVGNTGTEQDFLNSLKGASAYQLAVSVGGYTGTLDQWVASMKALYSVDGSIDGQVLTARGNAAVWEMLTKDKVGLGKVDNTSDLDKPISKATQTALDTKIG